MTAGTGRLLSAFIFMILLMTVNIAHSGSQEKTPSDRHIIVPPLRFVSPDDTKLWEGEIGGRTVAYFRSKKDGSIADIIVVTQDSLPRYFKRIEYLDKGGDGSLDMVKMKIYEMAKGWRDVGITRDNKYGIKFANTRYRGLLQKIKKARESGQ